MQLKGLQHRFAKSTTRNNKKQIDMLKSIANKIASDLGVTASVKKTPRYDAIEMRIMDDVLLFISTTHLVVASRDTISNRYNMASSSYQMVASYPLQDPNSINSDSIKNDILEAIRFKIMPWLSNTAGNLQMKLEYTN